jgi:glutamine amidotransferase
MFVHNGAIQDYNRLRRDLAFAVEPSLYPTIEGTTDSELMFKLALTFGLESDPIPALERMTGFVEDLGRQHGVEHPVQMTLGLSDGKRLFAVRYSTEHQSRTLYHSRRLAALKELYPELDGFSNDSYAIVSEPLSGMSELWERVPESSAVIVDSDGLNVLPFTPRREVDG